MAPHSSRIVIASSPAVSFASTAGEFGRMSAALIPSA
jgi:hypothetical protein